MNNRYYRSYLRCFRKVKKLWRNIQRIRHKARPYNSTCAVTKYPNISKTSYNKQHLQRNVFIGKEIIVYVWESRNIRQWCYRWYDRKSESDDKMYEYKNKRMDEMVTILQRRVHRFALTDMTRSIMNTNNIDYNHHEFVNYNVRNKNLKWE